MSRPNTARRLQYITTTAAAALICTFATGASAAQNSPNLLAGEYRGVYGADAVKTATASAADSTTAIAAKQKLVDDATTAVTAILTSPTKISAANTYVARAAADAAAIALVTTTSTALTVANTAVAAANQISAPLATDAGIKALNLTTAKSFTAATLSTYIANANPANLTAYNAAVAAQTLAQAANDTAFALAAPKLAATAAATDIAVTASGAAASAATAQGFTGTALVNAVTGLGTAGISGYTGLLTTQTSAQADLAAVTEGAAGPLAYAATVNGGATILTGIAATANKAVNAKAVARALLGTSIAGDSTSEVEMVRGLNNEELQRVDADNVLGGRIDVLGNRIDTETKDRTKADETEAQTRGDADVALGGRIDTEAQTCGDADVVLGGLIAVETTRATAAEGAEIKARAAAITAEQDARSSADTLLGTRVTGETTRATAAEGVLGGRIDTTNTRITILTTQVKKDIAAATAVSVALGGNSFLPGKKFNLTVNVGSYDGESALAAQFGYMVNDSLAINGGVASGFDSGSSTAVRGGFTYGW